MKVIALLLLGIFALIIVQCSSIHDGVVPTEPDYPLSSEAFSFALMGDTPYSIRQIELVEKLIREVNADSTVDLVLHAGDIKGSGHCNDQMYRSRFNLFQRFKKPFVYTIGDNEWADCHRKDNGRYYPLERLDFLRTIFFENPTQSSGSQPIPVRSQSTLPAFKSFVEHVMFRHKRIVFGTVHVVGSNNDLDPWFGFDPLDTFDAPRGDRLEEFKERQKAVSHWLHEIFRLAKETESPGIVILIQANPRFELSRDDEERAGFNEFIDTLRELTLDYDKPVLLAHGHIHYLWIDKPLYHSIADGVRERVKTLTRIQTPGSPFVRWLKVTVDPQSPDVFHLVDPFVHKLDNIPW